MVGGEGEQARKTQVVARRALGGCSCKCECGAASPEKPFQAPMTLREWTKIVMIQPKQWSCPSLLANLVSVFSFVLT